MDLWDYTRYTYFVEFKWESKFRVIECLREKKTFIEVSGPVVSSRTPRYQYYLVYSARIVLSYIIFEIATLLFRFVLYSVRFSEVEGLFF